MKRKKPLKTFFIVLGAVFISLLILCACLVLFFPNPDYSASEKRYLSEKPTLSEEDLLSGRFMDDTEDYMKDRFPLRTMLVSLKVSIDRLLGKKESQGVYFLKDNTLAEGFTHPTEEAFNDTDRAVSGFLKNCGIENRYFLLSPTAVWLKADKLPGNAPSDDQNAYITEVFEALPEDVTAVDVRAAFKENQKNHQIYYATDHHWTTDGAYYAAMELLKAMGEEPESLYERGVILDSFVGSLAAKSGFPVVTPDDVAIYRSASEPVYTVTYEKEHEMKASVYDARGLYSTDPYTVFFGGNYAEVTIEQMTESERKLLIIKDSYANALIPFLIPYFREIRIVDPRYYYDDISLLLEQEAFTDVLFLYNANTYSEDTSLKLLFEAYAEGEGSETDPSKEGPEGTEQPEKPSSEAEKSTEDEGASDRETGSGSEAGSKQESTTHQPAETTPAPETTPAETLPVTYLTPEDAVYVGDSRTVFMGSQSIGGVNGSRILPDSQLFATYGGTLLGTDCLINASNAGLKMAPAVFFWYGVNDLQVAMDRDDDQAFLSRYASMIETYRDINPDSRVIILSVVGTTPLEKDYYEGQNENLARYNEALKGYAARMGYTFVDLSSITDEVSFLPDNIHMTDAFYARLYNVLKNTLQD